MIQARPGRRWTILLAAAAVLCGLLAGCGREEGGPSQTETRRVDDSPATGTVTIWVGGAEGEALPDFLSEFEEENPDVDIEVTQIPVEEFDAKLRTAISTGNVPDLVRLYSQSQATLFAAGGFAPVPEGLVEPSAFFESAWDSTVVDGTAYGVPWDVYATIFQYRKDLADKAGLSAPATWEELKEFGRAMQEAGAEWGFGMDVGYEEYTAQALNEYVHQNGGSLLNEDGTAWTIDQDKNVEALEYWGSLFSEGLTSPDGPKFLDNVPWFTSGQMASKEMGPWFETWLADANGKDWVQQNLATAEMPAGPAGNAAALGAGTLAVLEAADNPDAAWKLVRYLVKSETQLAWYSAFGSLPSLKEAWNDPVIADNPLLEAERAALETAINVPQVPTWNEVATYLGEQMERVARGQASAADVLKDVQQFAESAGVDE